MPTSPLAGGRITSCRIGRAATVTAATDCRHHTRVPASHGPQARTRLHTGRFLLVVLPAACSACLVLQRLAHRRGSVKPCWIDPPPWLMPPIYTRSKGAPFCVNPPYPHLLGNAPPRLPAGPQSFPECPGKAETALPRNQGAGRPPAQSPQGTRRDRGPGWGEATRRWIWPKFQKAPIDQGSQGAGSNSSAARRNAFSVGGLRRSAQHTRNNLTKRGGEG